MRSKNFLAGLAVFALSLIGTDLLRHPLAHSISLLFALAVVVNTLYVSSLAGLLTAFGSMAVTSYFFMEPVWSFKVYSKSDVVQLVILLLIGIAGSLFKFDRNFLNTSGGSWKLPPEARLNEPQQ